MDKDYDYDEDIKIDIYNLHLAWSRHSEDVIKYGELWADQIALREHHDDKLLRLKDELKEEAARVGNDIRKNWKQHDLPKAPTDKFVESWVLLQESYREKLKEIYKTREELIELKTTENKLKMVYFDFCQNQKAALDNEVRLHISGYFSEPYVNDEDRGKINADNDLEEQHFGMQSRSRTKN